MGKFIVKYRKLILMLAGILIVPALIGFFNTRVNYDMLNYLPDSMDTVQGQNELMEEFGKGAFSIIITKNLDGDTIYNIQSEIKKVEHVDTVVGAGTLAETGVPLEMLPDSVYQTIHKGDEDIIAVFFDTSTSADETMAAIEEIRGIVNDKGYVSGMSALITDLRNLSESEQIFYVIIAVVLAIILMLALLDNWLAPLLFLVSIGVMILINLGSNLIFGEISYITKALSAILQLAVTMDYSIFLWNAYREHLEKDKGDSERAMEEAIKDTVGAVFGSSATTIAGFLALCFMTFTLGLDLGIVMAKGVVLGVIGSVTILPALILTFDKQLQRLDHKSILPSFDKLSRVIVKIFPVFVIIFVAIIPPFFYGYQKTNDSVYYEISRSLPADMDFAIANRRLSEDFGFSNVHMVLTSSEISQADATEMTDRIKQVGGVKSVFNLESVIGDEVPEEMLPDSVVGVVKSDEHELMLVVSEYKNATDEIAGQIEEINGIIREYDTGAILVGESSLTQDMIDTTSTDFRTVNIISIVAIFVIILVVTRSLSLPVILIAVIESAIFINLGIPAFTGTELPFIAPICISTIQLGATVDYAILLTTRYKRERTTGMSSREAARIAIKTSLPSIIVSGLVLFVATIGVAIYSRAELISSLTLLIARGAVISIVIVPTILPALLILADPLVIRTTLGMKKLTKESKK